MAFFFNAVKEQAKNKPAKRAIKRADIPIASLQQLGCSVCPRDKDDDLKSPKMAPSGSERSSVYLLGGSPSREEDDRNLHFTDAAGDAISKAFGNKFMNAEVRCNFIAQCAGDRTAVEIECCRRRIVADIEKTKPIVIVGIGDDPLFWATGIKGGALSHRGTLFNVKIGTHHCWFYCILYPNFVNKKNYGKMSEYELTLNHDVAQIKQFLKQGLPIPVSYSAPYDGGIEMITGNEPDDLQRLEKALQELAAEPKSAVDIETTGLRPFMLKDARILTVAVGTFKRTVAFAVDHPDGWGTSARRKAVKWLLFQYLVYSGKKAAHNLASEMEWFAFEFGAEFLRRTEWDDTMAMAHTLDERSNTKGLGAQTTIHFGFNVKTGSNIDTKRLLEYPLLQVLKYNALDTKWTDKLRDVLQEKIDADPKYIEEYLRKVRLAPTLVKTEIIGLDGDVAYAKKMNSTLLKTISDVEAKLKRCDEIKKYNQRFGTFSPDAPDQVLKLMRDICKRSEVRVEDKRTKTVRWTTEEEALLQIPKTEVPSAALILEHRGVAKLQTTYVQPFLDKKWVCGDGKIRTKYSAMHALSGRLNSEDPNVQNWPARKHREIRGIIYAPGNKWMAAFDYGQIEFRVAGMASEDKNLVKHCWTGYDVHKFWAERVVKICPPIIDLIVAEFSIDWDEKGIKTLRQEMKNKWVFPQIFGASMKSCAENLHLPEHIAEKLGAEFWDEFDGVRRWQEKLLANYEKNLYVETLGGRKRRGPMTKNEIINHPIQGTALDIVTAGMNGISEYSDLTEDIEIHPVFNGHDDLTFVMSDAGLELKMDIIAREMCKHRFDYINVPLVVEVKVGQRWHDLKEIKVYRSDQIFGLPNPYV